MRVSDVFEVVLALQVLQPVRRPAGFDAGPVLQQSVITSQLRVTLSRQPEQNTGDTSVALTARHLETATHFCHSPKPEESGNSRKKCHVGQREGLPRKVRVGAQLERNGWKILTSDGAVRSYLW